MGCVKVGSEQDTIHFLCITVSTTEPVHQGSLVVAYLESSLVGVKENQRKLLHFHVGCPYPVLRELHDGARMNQPLVDSSNCKVYQYVIGNSGLEGAPCRLMVKVAIGKLMSALLVVHWEKGLFEISSRKRSLDLVSRKWTTWTTGRASNKPSSRTIY